MSYLQHPVNYDKFPAVQVRGEHSPLKGWQQIAGQLEQTIADRTQALVVIDCYPGVDIDAIKAALSENQAFRDAQWFGAERGFMQGKELDARLADTLTDDRVFGVMSCANLTDYLVTSAAIELRSQIQAASGMRVIIGTGAALIVEGDVLVYADYPRWQRHLDWRAGASNWQTENPHEDILKKYKRGVFWEWRIDDRHKRDLFAHFDFYLDGLSQPAVVVNNTAFHAGLDACLQTPFRLNPFFDPGLWGGKWMEEVCDLPPSEKNYAWCFDGVPEENSLTLKYNGTAITLPAINLVLARPEALLGRQNYARFGAEFPIRFDFLDTMSGGNLSLQVHPSNDYIQQNFGMHYTQDESYYILDAGQDTSVWLGFQTGVKQEELVSAIEMAQETGTFDAEKYVNCFPVKKHDHVLIPAGTIHCSGSEAMILEISATPYIFTFKLWDWGRLGLDGKPRPVHLNHGKKVLREERNTEWCRRELVNAITPLEENAEYRCERTGLHELEFIDTHRYWISGAVTLNTNNEFQMLNLIEGQEAVIESPANRFAPFIMHYAETVIIPGSLGEYRLRSSTQQEIGIIVANVRQAGQTA